MKFIDYLVYFFYEMIPKYAKKKLRYAHLKYWDSSQNIPKYIKILKEHILINLKLTFPDCS